LEGRTLPDVAWNIVPSPNPGGTRYDSLNGVAAVSESDVWVNPLRTADARWEEALLP
jgi:hypothetical protein